MMNQTDNDFIDIVDNNHPISEKQNSNWELLVVDDEKSVHDATKWTLKNQQIFKRSLICYHAFNVSEALQILESRKNISLALIDVVMETEDAGLRLIEEIRNSGNSEIRIILRTGQPGYAPELAVITDYDINDYQLKTDLNREKFLAVITNAIRGYQQLHLMNEGRKVLQQIVEASGSLLQYNDLVHFSNEVLSQFSQFFGKDINGFVGIKEPDSASENTNDDFKIISGAGEYERYLKQFVKDIPQGLQQQFKGIKKENGAALEVNTEGTVLLTITSCQNEKAIVYVQSQNSFSIDEMGLLKIFGMNISACFRNINLIEKLDTMAYTNLQTGLPNMNSILSVAESLLEAETPIVVILFHINSMGRLFSLFESDIVRSIFTEVYYNISMKLPHAEQIARTDWGNFVVIIEQKYYDKTVLESLLDINVINEQIPLSLTVASCLSHSGEKDPHTLIQRAQLTMSTAKANFRNQVLEYSEGFTEQWKSSILLQHSLRDSFITGKNPLEVFLQKKVNSYSGEVIGAEALCRWKENGEYISPARFIPAIEAGGYSTQLLHLLLDEVAVWQRQQEKEGKINIPVSINLSIKDINKPQSADSILNYTFERGLNPKLVEFEVTEGLMMTRPEVIVNEVHKLRNAGFKIAVDDFGTGYSSLSYLKTLPMDILKIDRSFVTDLNVLNVRKSLAAVIASLAENLGLEIVVEGVETDEQSRALQFLGCFVCQGFLWGKPEAIRDIQIQ